VDSTPGPESGCGVVPGGTLRAHAALIHVFDPGVTVEAHLDRHGVDRIGRCLHPRVPTRLSAPTGHGSKRDTRSHHASPASVNSTS